MPIYEYECTSCGSSFEELQLGGATQAPSCPSCQTADEVRRRISASAVVFKGGGWYKDLYASPKPAAKKAGGDGEKAA